MFQFLRRWIEGRGAGGEDCRHLPFFNLTDEEMRSLAELAGRVGRDDRPAWAPKAD